MKNDALTREAIGTSNGYVFKTVGDAFCASFVTAAEAVGAVLLRATAQEGSRSA